MTELPWLEPRVVAELDDLLARRLLFLDGATGTMVQRRGLREADFRGDLLRDHPRDLKGNTDLLCLTRPDVVADVHAQYLAAGADLIETNTFTSTRIAQADYGTEHLAYDLNVAAARLARRATDAWRDRTATPRFAVGSIGPLNKTLSLSPDVNDPAFRAVTWAEVHDAYTEQVRGLIDGGAHLLLVETIFDTLNAKAALSAIALEFERRGTRLPVMISVTITDKSGRTLSGQTVEAFWASVSHARPWSVGLNCALGAQEIRPWLVDLAAVADCRISCYPNAGLPNAFGAYDESPETTGALVAEFARDHLVDVVGGCCGTTPDHIAAIVQACGSQRPRAVSVAVPQANHTRLSGLEPLNITAQTNFVVIGERTNVTGSKKFCDLVKADDFATATQVALDQVRGGANLIDVNMDEGMLDSKRAMTVFLNTIASEPEIARLPVMVDSSNWQVLQAGLQCLQGKGVVNSISLKDGEAAFVEKARTIARYGAAAVVMAFDEHGQATDTDRRVAICERAYQLLVGIGFAPQDIFFDPNVLAIGTGIEEHADYAVSFLHATRRIKQRCPGAKVSGGISNLSFAFRGNEPVRQAMNSAFLYHAIAAGLDMGIVNAGQVTVYSDISPDLLRAVEDVLFNRDPGATDRLVAIADRFKGGAKKKEVDLAWRQAPVADRIAWALVHGTVDHIEVDVAEALAELGSPLAVIEGPMMAGMRQVGDLFGAGKMFLPQVVKSARVMKKGVAWLEPHLAAAKASGQGSSQGTLLLATVKGDVHDIGKNIVGVVLACNGWDIVDLGVMVPCETILREAAARGVRAVGLSGLITPSLDEMVHVAQEMQRRGLTLPLLIGGATTSKQHTAVKIAPHYTGPVVHVLDASRAVEVAQHATAHDHTAWLEALRADQENVRQIHALRHAAPLLPYAQAQARRPRLAFDPAVLSAPAVLGRQVLARAPLAEIAACIDWTFLFAAFDLKGRFPAILDHPDYGAAARDLYGNAQALLERVVREGALEVRATWGMWPAAADGNEVALFDPVDPAACVARFQFLRQQQKKTDPDKPHLCLADFVAPCQAGVVDYVGAFAVSAGFGVQDLEAAALADHDDFTAILAKALADRLAEAAAEWLHAQVRRAWYAPDEALDNDALIAERYRGIRPAFGYPSCPDHTEKAELWRLLRPDELGITLTETHAVAPAASVCGLFLGHPDARYFAVGPVGSDQLADYARRKGIEVDQAERAVAGS
ncbi:MAG: methionine synthase [Deltaproteobacteria bacterium]|nr:methionine synthase [Deltaproteobacteria bacterium]